MMIFVESNYFPQPLNNTQTDQKRNWAISNNTGDLVVINRKQKTAGALSRSCKILEAAPRYQITT
jgi:hypothetical protein